MRCSAPRWPARGKSSVSTCSTTSWRSPSSSAPTKTFNAGDANVVEAVRDATSGGVDYAFEVVGSVKAMELAYKITRRGGETVSSGLSHPDHSFSIQHVNLVGEERTIRGSYLGSCVPGTRHSRTTSRSISRAGCRSTA